MQSISRRGFVISAATASAVFGLDGTLEFVSPAQAQKGSGSGAGTAGLTDRGFARFSVGDIKITTVFDGQFDKPHDPGFITNASVEETKAALQKAGLPGDVVPITFTVTFVEIGGKIIMFDSGTGGQMGGPKAGLLSKSNLAKAGIDPSGISTIVVTHFHGDHILGLMSKENAQVFPNAEIVMPRSEYAYWTDPALPAKLPPARQGLVKRIQATFPNWTNIQQVTDGKEAIKGVVAMNTNGHTPGHTSYHLNSGSNQFIVAGDITNIVPLFVAHPGWHAAFDQDPVMAEAARRTFFDRVVADKAVVSGYHWGMPGAGTIQKDGKGYALVPVDAA